MQMNSLPHFDAVILADGEFPTADIPLQILREAKFLCCCDGAAAKAIAQGFMPDAIVGDGDSLEHEFKTRYAAIIHLESEEDHTIGNIFLLPRYVQQFGITPEIYTDHGWFSVINGTTELPSFPGQQVSIFNITGKKVEGEGFTWPPYTYKELWQGTLNEAKSDRILLKTDGIMIVFRTYLAKKT